MLARARELAPRYALQPHADRAVGARWAAAVLGRLLLLPDDDELVLLGGIKHDLNLGTQALVPMVDANCINDCIIARGLAVACTVPAPPMWLGGSFAALSPSHAYLYTLFGANRLPANVFGEAQCGTVQVGLFGRDGRAALENVNVYHTGLGDLRLRIPLSRAHGGRNDRAAAGKARARGAAPRYHRPVRRERGKASRDRGTSRPMAAERLTYAGLESSGRHFRASSDDGMLLIPVDGFEDEVADLHAVALTSLEPRPHPGGRGSRHEAKPPRPRLTWRLRNRSAGNSDGLICRA